MKVFIFDADNCGLNFAVRCLAEGHQVRLWLKPKNTGEVSPLGKGMVERVKEWKPSMKWADIIVFTSNNHYHDDMRPFFKAGYPILGTNEQSAQLELDRSLGQQVLDMYKIPTPPYQRFNDFKQAAEFVAKTKKAYVLKPWGGMDDKATTYVSNSSEDMLFVLERMDQEHTGKKQEFMLQEKIAGNEMAVSAWFGPGGFGQWKEENWEEKKFMNDNLGCNTGEQGTTMRYVKESKLFDEMLLPMEDYLHGLDYVGNVDMNCIVDKTGQAWPLEFTMRLGWPAFNIHLSMCDCDPVEWMADLLDGDDTFRPNRKIAVGVVLTHKDFPSCKIPAHETYGYPIYGITSENLDHIHWVEVMYGSGKYSSQVVTAGWMPAVVTGNASSVSKANELALKTCKELTWPSNKMHRTDIGKRLEKQLPELQKHGYATGMVY
jgi:phosphoribosylamine--glycine ligase